GSFRTAQKPAIKVWVSYFSFAFKKSSSFRQGILNTCPDTSGISYLSSLLFKMIFNSSWSSFKPNINSFVPKDLEYKKIAKIINRRLYFKFFIGTSKVKK